jgi:hypothetical protein
MLTCYHHIIGLLSRYHLTFANVSNGAHNLAPSLALDGQLVSLDEASPTRDFPMAMATLSSELLRPTAVPRSLGSTATAASRRSQLRIGEE